MHTFLYKFAYQHETRVCINLLTSQTVTSSDKMTCMSPYKRKACQRFGWCSLSFWIFSPNWSRKIQFQK